MKSDVLLKLAAKYAQQSFGYSGDKLKNALTAVDYSTALDAAVNAPGAYGVTYMQGDKYGVDVEIKPGLAGIDYIVYGKGYMPEGSEPRYTKGSEIFRKVFQKYLARPHLQALRNANLSDEERQALVQNGDRIKNWIEVVIP